jgi:hypothetical protein
MTHFVNYKKKCSLDENIAARRDDAIEEKGSE